MLADWVGMKGRSLTFWNRLHIDWFWGLWLILLLVTARKGMGTRVEVLIVVERMLVSRRKGRLVKWWEEVRRRNDVWLSFHVRYIFLIHKVISSIWFHPWVVWTSITSQRWKWIRKNWKPWTRVHVSSLTVEGLGVEKTPWTTWNEFFLWWRFKWLAQRLRSLLLTRITRESRRSWRRRALFLSLANLVVIIRYVVYMNLTALFRILIRRLLLSRKLFSLLFTSWFFRSVMMSVLQRLYW